MIFLESFFVVYVNNLYLCKRNQGSIKLLLVKDFIPDRERGSNLNRVLESIRTLVLTDWVKRVREDKQDISIA